ncbi:MAG: hypothetical protein ACR2KL_08940 [Nocardioidaceae bacterium]
MTKQTRYTLGADIPADEVLHDSAGRVVDDAYVEAAVHAARDYTRGRGRPSLSRSGESPLLRVRLPADLDEAVRRAAEQAGTSRADWVRQVLDQASRRTA